MAKRKKSTSKSDATSATVGYEAQLWQMADALRDNMAAAIVAAGCVISSIFRRFLTGLERRRTRIGIGLFAGKGAKYDDRVAHT
ncbi:MAG: hypothetical protein D6781_06700 [Verrucomicrobia bacterium]|nr:MAG: hypothetical protein D6781_06700 [Verrucomicrobiota bacterium]